MGVAPVEKKRREKEGNGCGSYTTRTDVNKR